MLCSIKKGRIFYLSKNNTITEVYNQFLCRKFLKQFNYYPYRLIFPFLYFCKNKYYKKKYLSVIQRMNKLKLI